MVLDTLEKRDAKAEDFKSLETIPIASQLSVFSIRNGDPGMFYSKKGFSPGLSPLKLQSGMLEIDEAADAVPEMRGEDREPLRMRLSDQFMAHGDRPTSSSSTPRPRTSLDVAAGSRPHTPLGVDAINLIGSVIGSVEAASAMALPGGTGDLDLNSSWQPKRTARQGAAGRPMTADCVPAMSHQTRPIANVFRQDMPPAEHQIALPGSSNDSPVPPTASGNPYGKMMHVASADGIRGAAVMDGSSTGDAGLRTGPDVNPVEDASRWRNQDHGRPWTTSEASGVATMTPQPSSSSRGPDDGNGTADVSPHLVDWGWGS